MSIPGNKGEEKRGAIPFLAVFLLDACYITTVTAAFSFFVFWANNGRFRWYLAAGAIGGVVLYFRTIGKPVEIVLAALVRLLKKLFGLLIVKPADTLLKLIGRGCRGVVRFAWRHTVLPLNRCFQRIRAEARTARVEKNLVRDIRFPGLEEERERERR